MFLKLGDLFVVYSTMLSVSKVKEHRMVKGKDIPVTGHRGS
jgi:hypothetical protein